MSDDRSPIEGEPLPPVGRHLKDRVVKGTLWFMSGTAARALLRLIVMAILARLLVPEEFGLVGAAGIFVAFAELFATSGIAHSVVQRKELEPRHVRAAFTGNMAMALLTAGVMWLLAGQIAVFFRMAELEPILKLLALLYPINAFGGISRRLLARDLSYGKLAAVEVASYAFGYALVALPLAFSGYGAWALIYAIMGSAIVRNILSLVARRHSFRLSADRRSYKELMSTGLGFSLVRWAGFIAQKGDYFVVGRWLGAAPLGLYERAYVLMDLSNSLLTNALNTVLFPTFAKIQDDRRKLAAAFERLSAMLSLIFFPVGAIASLLAPEIVAVLLGSGWSAAVDPFRVLAIGMFFRTSFKVSSVLANGVGAPYSNALYLSIYGALVVTGALITFRFGITAVAASTLFALAVVYGLLTNHSLAITGMRWPQLLRAYRPALLVSMILIGAVAAVAEPLRMAGLPPIAILAAAAIVSFMITIGLARFTPAIFGSHGQWILDAVVSSVFRRKSRV